MDRRHVLLKLQAHAQVTKDISHLTFADVLTGVGKRTDVVVRFSTVTGAAGSPEWLRDPRGFAVKMYTRQGNWGSAQPANACALPAAFTLLLHLPGLAACHRGATPRAP